MHYITIKDQKIIDKKLPLSTSLQDHVLTIQDHAFIADTIKISLLDENNDTLKIHIGKHAEAKFILEVKNETRIKNEFDIEVNMDVNSKVKYLLVSELKSDEAILNHHFNINKDANLEILGGFVSNVLTSNLHINLLGEQASVKLRTVAISSETHFQNIDCHITHKAPYTFGDMTNIGIAGEKGKIILNGIEKIEKGMHQANAFQTLKGIITSDHAVVEVNPILLIDEYDVKAGHGATIGKIEEDVLYYLRSRGLTKSEAEKLVIMGFLQPVIDEIDDEPLRERFVSLIEERI